MKKNEFFSKALQLAKKGFESLLSAAFMLFVLVGAAFLFYSFLKVYIEPLAPVITILIVTVFTLMTLEKRENAIMAFGGLIMYGLSWPIAWEWGIVPCLIVWAAGMLLWFAAVGLSWLDVVNSKWDCSPAHQAVT